MELEITLNLFSFARCLDHSFLVIILNLVFIIEEFHSFFTSLFIMIILWHFLCELQKILFGFKVFNRNRDRDY